MADPFVMGAFVGVGYGSQTVKTPGIGPTYEDRRQCRDVKDGFVFALTVALQAARQAGPDTKRGQFRMSTKV